MNDFKYSCHNDIITICSLALQVSPVDITIVCGHRNMADQNKAYNEKKSRVKWPNSSHNSSPSNAVDLVPYINGVLQWNNIQQLHLVAGLIIGIGAAQNVPIRWGGAWDGQLNKPWKFNDLYHFELIL